LLSMRHTEQREDRTPAPDEQGEDPAAAAPGRKGGAARARLCRQSSVPTSLEKPLRQDGKMPIVLWRFDREQFSQNITRLTGPSRNAATRLVVDADRFTRQTDAFTKKIENHARAVALRSLYHYFVRPHQTLKVSPAMAGGVTNRL
jgi:hypothetical protein